jgi:CheY-like chemotaxis protein
MVDEKKISVLVVDDRPEWWMSFQAKSKKSPSSFINIHTSSTFEDGLVALSRDKTFDIVVVDLHLDHDRNAFQFIEEAKKQGNFLPYAITSQEAKNSALGNEDTMKKYIESQAADYIEKSEIKRLSIFQDRIRNVLNALLFALQGMLQLYIIEQMQKDEKLYLINQEMIWMTRLLASYSTKVKTKSFDRLCKSLSALAEQCAAMSNDSLRRGLSPAHADILQLKTGPAAADSATELLLEDCIPYGQPPVTVRNVRHLGALCRARNASAEKVQNALAKLQEDKPDLQNSEVELLTLHVAESFARSNRIDTGVEVLYFLSQLYANKGRTERVALVDLLIANFLIQHDRPSQAMSFLKSASAYTDATADPALKSAIEATLFLHRDRIVTDAAS